MKVQTGDDTKVLPANEERPAEDIQPSMATYDLKNAYSSYMSFSKHFLLFLAIVATFLACLLFARDLSAGWAENKKSETAKLHPTSEDPTNFPLTSNLSGELPRFPSDVAVKTTTNDDDPTVRKMTKIIVRIRPTEDNPFQKTIINNQDSSSPIEPFGIMNMMMNLMKDEENKSSGKPGPAFLGDLPFFKRHSHPKLIIVKRINPSSNQKDDEMFKNIINNLFTSSSSEDKLSSEVGSRIPISPRDPLNGIMDSIFSKITDDIMQNSLRSSPRLESFKDEISTNGDKYNKLVKSLAEQSDLVLDDLFSLKSLVKKEMSKLATTNEKGEPESAADTLPSPSTERLNKYFELLNKMGVSLTEVNVLLKNEHNKITNNPKNNISLNQQIDELMSSLQKPMDDVFQVSTKLTKFTKDFPVELAASFIKLGHGLIKFGRMFEDVTELKESAILDKANDKSSGEENESSIESFIPKARSEIMPPRFFHRKIIIFKNLPNTPTPTAMPDAKEAAPAPIK